MPVPERDLTSAAVLVPIVDHPDGLTVLLTQRTNHLRDHAGQVSFPGVGRLDRYVTRTGYEVVPVVGFVNPPLDVKPDPFEVADIFEVPLQFLANPDNHQRHSRYYNGARREFYAMPYNGYYIWGATAGMIVNLSEALT